MTTTSTQSQAIDRRTFVKTASAAGLGLALGSKLAAAATEPARRRRYAIIGTGHRHRMYHTAILGDHKEHAELVALCDINPGRVEVSRKNAAEAGAQVPGYSSNDFEKMIRETKPDYVIVTTVD